MKEQSLSIIDLWQLLQPSDTFDTRGRYEHCLRVWEKLDAAQRTRIYHLLATKKENGEYVNPNPCFALDDALQEDECAQAKIQKQQPDFLRGDEGGHIVQVRYNGQFKLCRPETVQLFNLTITKDPW